MAINGIDNIQDLIAAAQQTSGAAANKEKDKENQSSDQQDQPSFDELLRGRLGSNIVFTNLEAQLGVPKRTSTDDDNLPALERRPEASSDDSDADTFDSATAADNSAAPARQDDATRNDDHAYAGPVQDPNANANRNTAGDGQQQQSQARADNANANKAGDQANKADAGKAEARTGVVNTEVVQQETDIDPADLPGAKGKGNANANAKVTKEAAEIASQPQNTLAAKSTLDAETGRATQIRENAARNTESDVDIELQDGSAQNIFNRGKANAAQQAGTNGKQGNEAKANADGTNQAQGNQQNQQNANQAQNAGFQSAVNANARAATHGQTSQQGQLSVDAASGGTSVSGENNAVQQRSTTPKSAQAQSRPNLPAHALADQVAVNIQRGVAQGQDRINVQLRPAELGKVEIKMEMNHDGRMTAVISAERPETLDMLRQDSRSLIDALNQIGLRADSNSLSFNLQGQGAGEGNGQDQANTASGGGGADVPEELSLFDNFDDDMGGLTADGRLDFRV